MGIFRQTSIALSIISITACSVDGVRGKNPISVSPKGNENVVTGMYVEQVDWQCASEPCQTEKRFYNEDFSDYVVVKGDFGSRDVGRVIEGVGMLENDVFNVRKYRRRSIVDYNLIVSSGTDLYMKKQYGCVVAWNRNFEWDYDKSRNSVRLHVILNHPLAPKNANAPQITLYFDGFSGLFVREERQNVDGELCAN